MERYVIKIYRAENAGNAEQKKIGPDESFLNSVPYSLCSAFSARNLLETK